MLGDTLAIISMGENDKLKAENEKLKATIAELTEQIGQLKHKEDEAKERKCKWEPKENYSEFTDDYWESACDHLWTLEEGTPKDNEMKYCPFCGLEIEHE